MDAADRALLAETINAALVGKPDAALTVTVLTELGWLDMLDSETDAAVAIVFEALGRVNASPSVLDDVIVHALGLTPRTDLAVLLPPFGSWNTAADAGLATARVRAASELLVVRGERACTVATDAVDVQPIRGIDPDAGLHTVRVDVGGKGTEIDDGAWNDAVALAQRAIAHEIMGASRAMLDLARTHALERVQFGRSIARFQAVRHRLAEALVAIEALDATLAAAADTPGPGTAQLAKAVAGRTARAVAAHCQQVLAGIGFTTDHPFHRYLKRTIVLDGVFGSSDDLVRAIGSGLLAARVVPTLIEL